MGEGIDTPHDPSIDFFRPHRRTFHRLRMQLVHLFVWGWLCEWEVINTTLQVGRSMQGPGVALCKVWRFYLQPCPLVSSILSWFALVGLEAMLVYAISPSSVQQHISPLHQKGNCRASNNPMQHRRLFGVPEMQVPCVWRLLWPLSWRHGVYLSLRHTVCHVTLKGPNALEAAQIAVEYDLKTAE